MWQSERAIADLPVPAIPSSQKIRGELGSQLQAYKSAKRSTSPLERQKSENNMLDPKFQLFRSVFACLQQFAKLMTVAGFTRSRRVQTELSAASTLHRTSVLIPKKNTGLFGSEPSIFVHSRNDSLTATCLGFSCYLKTLFLLTTRWISHWSDPRVTKKKNIITPDWNAFETDSHDENSGAEEDIDEDDNEEESDDDDSGSDSDDDSVIVPTKRKRKEKAVPEPSPREIQYTTSVYTFEQTKKSRSSRGSPILDVFTFSSDKPWNTLKSRIRTNIRTALHLEMFSIDDYTVTFTVPRQVTESIPLTDYKKYKILVSNALKIKGTPSAKIVIEPKVASKQKENNVTDSGTKGKGTKVRKERDSLPANVALNAKIGALRERWMCPTPNGQCGSEHCFVHPDEADHFALSHAHTESRAAATHHLANPLPDIPPANGRRRASVSGRRAGTVEANPPLPTNDELEDERTQYVLIDDDIVPDAATQRKSRAYAAQWRGGSALEPSPQQRHTPFVFGAPPPPHPTLLHPCAPSPFASTSAAAAYTVLPPSYALHATAPAPSQTLLTRYPNTITPKSEYLLPPTNGYAHPRIRGRRSGSFILWARRWIWRWMQGAWVVAVLVRESTGRGRWVRSSCWPNAEVRAYVCGGGDGRRRVREDERRRRRDREQENEAKTHFGIFATRALRQGEEIVVGWEWDDGNAVHRVGEVAGNGGPHRANAHAAESHRAARQHPARARRCGGGVCVRSFYFGFDGDSCTTRCPRTGGFCGEGIWASVVGTSWEGKGAGAGEDALERARREDASGSRSAYASSVRWRRWCSARRAGVGAIGYLFVIDVIFSSYFRGIAVYITRAFPHLHSACLHVHIRLLVNAALVLHHLDNEAQTQTPHKAGRPATRGARALGPAHRRRAGKGGEGGVVLEGEGEVYAGSYAREGEGYAGVYGYGYTGEGHGDMRPGADAYTSAHAGDASTSKAYAVVERAGGWDVVHEGYGVRRWEMEEEGGDGDADKPARTERARGKSRRHDRERDGGWDRGRVRGRAICPPKMRKRWKPDAVQLWRK
ncbi:hypothetical protein B0H14DRAFT_3557770 [Mycena olivaceomarginata]|nr:hypothetical protein B0H14DRAFT_3557770 [Mycena olivaceomarginata]